MIAPQDCESCGLKDGAEWSDYCAARVCFRCDHHNTLARCFCGWSTSGDDGRRELIEMGETIGDGDWS